MARTKRLVNNEQGFTLIEIIAVLVLLGILAAVAVPKFIDMQDEAQLKAVQSVKMELAARANQYHAKYLLTKTGTEHSQDAAAWALEDIGEDFSMTGSGTAITIRPTSDPTVTYNLPFTIGTNTSAASFGTITKNP